MLLQGFWQQITAAERACSLMMLLLTVANASVSVTVRVSRGSTAALLLLKESGLASAQIAADAMTLLAAVWQATPVSDKSVASVRGQISAENCTTGLGAEALAQNACVNIVAAMTVHSAVPAVLEVRTACSPPRWRTQGRPALGPQGLRLTTPACGRLAQAGCRALVEVCTHSPELQDEAINAGGTELIVGLMADKSAASFQRVMAAKSLTQARLRPF